MCYAKLYGKEFNGELSVIKRSATRYANSCCRLKDTLKIYDHRYPYGHITHVYVRDNKIYGSDGAAFKGGKWKLVYER